MSSKFIEENIGPVQEVHYKNNPDILIASCCGNIGALDEIKSKCVCKKFFDKKIPESEAK